MAAFAPIALLALTVCAGAAAQQAPSPSASTAPYQLWRASARVGLQDVVQQLARADVVFIGENHDDPGAHRLELDVLQALHSARPRLALSMEMFERDVQGVLDEYLGGFITEPSFKAASRPWSNYQTDYRPLIEFCKEQQIPVLAANTPRRYVNLVARRGARALAKLPREARAYLPRLPYSMELPAGYRKELTAEFDMPHGEPASAQAHAPAAVPPQEVQQMIEAQALWDAGMADSIAKFARSHPGTEILQINGAMHSDSGYGIVARLRRLNPRLHILVLSVKPLADLNAPPSQEDQARADWVATTAKRAAR